MRLLLVAAAVFLAASLARAETPRVADAKKVAAAGQEASCKADWKAYAGLLHPDSLEAFRSRIVPALQAADRAGKADRELLAIFDEARDVKTVLGWKPEEFFERTMRSLTRVPTTRLMFTTKKSKVLGVVTEGKDLAHVVVRTTQKIGTEEMIRVETVTLKVEKGTWKLLPDDLVKSLAEGIARTCELHARK